MSGSPPDISHRKVIIATGPSGAGRSTAIRTLEDLGYEAIDNIPLRLIPRLFEDDPSFDPIAFSADVRNRDFSADALIALVDELARDPLLDLTLIYLEAQDDVLIRRFSETRRRHPMAPEGDVQTGIALERDLLRPIKARADILIDTTRLTPHDLKSDLSGLFARETSAGMAVTLQSFSYKRGVPRGTDIVMDCRFLQNPHWDETLRPLDGRDAQVQTFVAKDPRFDEFFARLSELATMLLPAYVDEGKSHLTIGFGCSGGRHRSVAVTERLGQALETQGWRVSIRHRELERGSGGQTPTGT